MESLELKSAGTSLAGSIISMTFGWIPVSVAQETIEVAIISLLIGWLGGKLLKKVDEYFDKKFRKKKPKIKLPEA